MNNFQKMLLRSFGKKYLSLRQKSLRFLNTEIVIYPETDFTEDVLFSERTRHFSEKSKGLLKLLFFHQYCSWGREFKINRHPIFLMSTL